MADGGGLSLNVDGQTPHAHALMKFPSLIGAAAGQVPAGAAITSATLQVNCTNAGQAMRLYRVTESWNENEATWNERAAGVPWTSPGADGAGSNAGVSVNGDCTVVGQRSIDITQFVQEWSSGAPNHGVVFIDCGTDGVDFDSSESSISPVLTVVYKTSLQAIETKSIAGPVGAGQLLDDSHARPHISVERARDRHGRPAELGAVGFRADRRRRVAGSAGADRAERRGHRREPVARRCSCRSAIRPAAR